MPLAIRLQPALDRIAAGQSFTIRDLGVLMQCHASPQKVLGISAALNMPKPSVTRAIDHMSSLPEPFLVREPDLDDRRSPWIKLTASGAHFVNELVISYAEA